MKKLLLRPNNKLLFLIWASLRWHIKYYFTKKGFPLACGMYITNMCNLKCRICNVWLEPEKCTIDFAVYSQIIKDLKTLGCYYFSISGGEPLLVKDIVVRLTFAKKNLPYVHLVSNGINIDKELAKLLAKTGLDEISISIDGMAKVHDSLRGMDGAFDLAIRGIDNLKKHAPNISIVINSIISPDNIGELYKVVDLVRDLGLYHKFQPLNEHPILVKGENKKNRLKKYTHEQTSQLKKIIDFLKTRRNVANSHYFLKSIPSFFNSKGDILCSKCLFPYHHCEINADGKVYPCFNGMKWKGGVQIKENLIDAYYSFSYKRIAQGLRNCNLCKSQMYICNYEPRIVFPLSNFIRYNIFQ